jgi:outer membrane biosynthesis protein TonB
MKTQIRLVALSAALIGSSAFANETQFPSHNRTLTSLVPAECKQWTAPKTLARKDVSFPTEVNALRGDVALLVRIAADGSYQGIEDSLSSDDAFLREAENSVREWSFAPAVCNGQRQASLARVDFQFKREGSISYKTGGFFSR